MISPRRTSSTWAEVTSPSGPLGPDSKDGVVPYWSSHMDGAESELIVPSGHSAHQNALAIEEVDRILKLNLKN